MIRIAVVGMSKPTPDYNWEQAVCNVIAMFPKGAQLVSGGAKGIDSMAEKYYRQDMHLKQFPEPNIIPAKWRENGVYNKAAGMIRNGEIVKNADAVIAFWDYKSPGTANTIDRAKRAGKPVLIVDKRTSGRTCIDWIDSLQPVEDLRPTNE